MQVWKRSIKLYEPHQVELLETSMSQQSARQPRELILVSFQTKPLGTLLAKLFTLQVQDLQFRIQVHRMRRMTYIAPLRRAVECQARGFRMLSDMQRNWIQSQTQMEPSVPRSCQSKLLPCPTTLQAASAYAVHKLLVDLNGAPF